MKHRKQIVSLLLLSSLLVGGGVWFASSCSYNDSVCITSHGSVSQPVVFFSLAFLVTCLALFFVSEKTYKSWRRFAYWAIPISIILLWLAPTDSPGGIGISYLNYTKEAASWLLSGAFLLISLWIIIRKSLHSN